jgi:hypothetical protein
LIIDDAPHTERHPRQAEVAIWVSRTWASGTWWPLGV